MMIGYPHVRRVLAAAAIAFGLLGTASTAQAQQAADPTPRIALVPGTRVRVTATTLIAPLIANFMQTRGDTAVFIADGGGRGVWSIAISDIRQIERSSGERKTNRPYVIRGAGWGGAAGAVLGYTFAATAKPADSTRKYNRLGSLGIGAAGGAVIGALIGSRFGTERWVPVPVRQVSITPRRNGTAVGFSFTF